MSHTFMTPALPLDAHCNAHATTDAERGETLLRIALLHLVQECDEDTGARRTDRMADGDRAAVDVDLGGIPAEVLVDRAGLGRECLVGLDQVEVSGIPAGLLERLARGR